MHEYEFRLVVESPVSFLPLIQTLGYPLRKQIVYYAKPHFRFRNKKFETKRILSTNAVYHDKLWFRWVHSLETPYQRWSRSTCMIFLHNIGNYQNPFAVESRTLLTIDSQAQLYTFRVAPDFYKLIFEWEYGTFPKPLSQLNPAFLLDSLSRYRDLYNLMKPFKLPLYKFNEQLTRKSVTCIEAIPEGEQYLYAHKLDGTFGLVYSYQDKIKEKWEGYECVVRKDVTLGDGLVFAAERLQGGQVYLLDVYQFRGHNTAKWSRRKILVEFLAELEGSAGYFVQTYVSDRNALLADPPVKTDGLIVHDVVQDVIFKFKTSHSIDLVFHEGYFYLPGGRIKCSEELEDGSVYEISTEDGRVLRKRRDRFKGNTAAQLENIFKNGWHGPLIEPLPEASKNKKTKRK